MRTLHDRLVTARTISELFSWKLFLVGSGLVNIPSPD